MKKLCLLLGICCFSFLSYSQHIGATVSLPNGWKLSPAGKSFPLGDLPLNMVISHSKKWAAVTNNGQSKHSVYLIDLAKQQVVDSMIVAKAWYGLAFNSDDSQLFVSGGHDNKILRLGVSGGKLSLLGDIKLGDAWPNRIAPSGLAFDDARQRLYVVTRDNRSLYIIDAKSNQILKQFGLDGEAYMCLLSPSNNELYISCWGCNQVLVFDLKTNLWKKSIEVGDNPNEMVLHPNGKTLMVCNANDNSVSVIDLSSQKVVETLDVALYPNSPAGSTTNGLAIDPKNNYLYIANADNNCLAVFDVNVPGKSQAKGFIPVGWYPSNVKVINNQIWVINGKGNTSMANPYGPRPVRRGEEVNLHAGDSNAPKEVQYIGSMFKGTMSVIPRPKPQELPVYTRAAYENSAYQPEKSEMADKLAPGFPIPMKAGQVSPIKYVFYVIKENRTYDQVLADVKGGNGDTTLLLFGRKYTPNQHAIAESFVLLDNFYVDAEVSADGHHWTMGAYATDYMEKSWPTSYGGRGGGIYGEAERSVSQNKNGYIWDQCNRYGVTFRTYGEFVTNGKANIPVLNNRFHPTFPSYNLAIQDTTRLAIWKKEFEQMVKENRVPRFNSLRMGNDHTEGLRIGRPTPYAHVADNDLAVGQLIETLAKSPIWNETAVFILEDDAQNGADHVDAHRSTAYVAGGFVKRNFVDHTMYTTSSMLRTMELILGLPPMTQYDAAAMPMWRSFDAVAKPFEFKAIIPQINLLEKNVVRNEWQRQSELFNFEKEDANNDVVFNRVLWHGLKGNVAFPGPKRAAFIFPVKKKEKGED
ncbi:alkaline phosphatase family protein [Aquirufa salirivi]|uniref:Bifunctional YncE family protein/alkaline phosphatase family protein n=1 Tax=Aquirufa salirivi TaxID=3104729 RepID=A0ABW8RTI4_9BACT